MSILCECTLFHNDIEKITGKDTNYSYALETCSLYHTRVQQSGVGRALEATHAIHCTATHTLKPDLQWDGIENTVLPSISAYHTPHSWYTSMKGGGGVATGDMGGIPQGKLTPSGSGHCALLLTCSVSNVQLSHILIIVCTKEKYIKYIIYNYK